MSYGYGPPQFAFSTSTTLSPLYSNTTANPEQMRSKLAAHIGNFQPFYIAIAICTLILGCLIILNVVCSCSRYSEYWLDRHTGNRWLVSIWTTTPHKQPPVELSEVNIEYVHLPRPAHPEHSEYEPYDLEKEALHEYQPETEREHHEMRKRESEI